MSDLAKKYKTLLALTIPDMKVFAPMTEVEISKFCDIRERDFGIRPSKTYCDLLRISKGASWYNDGVELNLADPENMKKDERWDVGAAFESALVLSHMGNGDQILVDIKSNGEPGIMLYWEHDTPSLSVYCTDLASFFDVLIRNWNHPENTSTDQDTWLEFALFEPIEADRELGIDTDDMTVDFDTAMHSKNPGFRKFAEQAGPEYYFVNWNDKKPHSGAHFPDKWLERPSLRNDEDGLMFAMKKTNRKPSWFDLMLKKITKSKYP